MAILDMPALPDFSAQVSGIFVDKPTNYLASRYGVTTALDMELAWSTMHISVSFPRNISGTPLLSWLPDTSRRTFEDARRLQHVESPRVPKSSKRRRSNSSTESLKRRRVCNESPCNDRLEQICQTKSSAQETQSADRPGEATIRKSTAHTSHFWSPEKKPSSPSATPDASVPFADLDSSSYGLIQEELAQEPFKMFVAVLFLVKTRGTAAIPTMRKLLEFFPTAESLAAAEPEDLFPDIKHLGLANRRANALIDIAKAWVDRPPEKGKRYVRRNYPAIGDGKDVLASEQPIPDESEDPRLAFEVCHLPHVAAYGIDSWRIFCRDLLRGVPDGLIARPVSRRKNKGRNAEAIKQELQQEWTKVNPTDKELRGYVKWRWLRLGWLWDAQTGTRTEIRRKDIKKLQNGQLKDWKGYPNPWL